MPFAVSPDSSRQRSSPAALALALCLGIGYAAAAGAEPLVVDVVRFADVAEMPLRSAPATVEPRNAPDLAAEVAGRIIDLPVRVGDRVSQGDLLARLDCQYYEAALEAARAELQRARAVQRFAAEQLKRARDLQRNKSISDEELDQRRTDLATAQADTVAREQRRQQAQIDVDHCELHAPFDAAVTQRQASVGSYVSRGTVIVSLIETGGQEVSVALRNDQVSSMTQASVITFDSDGARYPVRLRSLLPAIDPTTRTREARLVFVADPASPGTAGRLAWQGRQTLVPADFLVRRSGTLGIFVLDGETAKFQALPQAQDGRPAAVDLDPETLLISDGRQRVRDGDRVARRTVSE